MLNLRLRSGRSIDLRNERAWITFWASLSFSFLRNLPSSIWCPFLLYCDLRRINFLQVFVLLVLFQVWNKPIFHIWFSFRSLSSWSLTSCQSSSNSRIGLGSYFRRVISSFRRLIASGRARSKTCFILCAIVENNLRSHVIVIHYLNTSFISVIHSLLLVLADVRITYLFSFIMRSLRSMQVSSRQSATHIWLLTMLVLSLMSLKLLSFKSG